MSYDLAASLAITSLFASTAEVGMQDFSSLVHLCHYALVTQGVEGEVVEFGCFRGDTAKLVAAIVQKTVHVYDSFQGLPAAGEPCVQGAMMASVADVQRNFAQMNLEPPVIHAGWFCDLKPDDLPERVAFAHLDGDLYVSTIQALRLVYPRLSVGAIVLIDDFGDGWFEGPKQACDEFFADKPEKATMLPGLRGVHAFKAVAVKVAS